MARGGCEGEKSARRSSRLFALGTTDRELSTSSPDDKSLSVVLPGEVGSLHLDEGRHHDLSVVRVKEVAELANAVAEGSEDESTVGDGLGSRSGELEVGVGRRAGVDLNGGREGAGDDIVLDSRGALLERLADAREEHNFLDVAQILLVDAHDVEEGLDLEALGLGELGEERIVEADGEAVGLDAASEPSNSSVAESSETASDLGLENHADGNALAVEDVGSDDGLDGMAKGVAKVDEVAKTGLLLVDGDNVSLGGDGGADDGEEEGLGSRASFEGAAGAGLASRVAEDSRVDLGDTRLELGELGLIPDGGGLRKGRSACEFAEMGIRTGSP